MTDFITKNTLEDEPQKAGFFDGLKSFFNKSNSNHVTLLSEADFNDSINHAKPDMFESSVQEVQASDKLNEVKKRVKKKKPSQNSQTITIHSGDISAYKKHVPIIGNMPVRTQYLLSSFVMALGITGIFFAFLMITSAQSKTSLLQQDITSLVADLQTLSSYAYRSTNDESALKAIDAQKVQIDRRIARIDNLSTDLDVAASPALTQMEITKNWQQVASLLPLLERNNSEQINSLNNSISNLSAFLNSKSTSNPNINSLVEAIGKIKGYSGTLASSSDAVLIDLIQRESLAAKTSILNLKYADTLGVYQQSAYSWLQISSLVDDIITNSYLGGRGSAANISNTIISSVNQINTGLFKFNSVQSAEDRLGRNLIYLFVGLLVFAAITIVYIYLYEKENSTLQDKIENQHNNQAIVRVLDEVGPLSEGDLTKVITVDHELTGAIADAINIMVSEIRSVVSTIRDSAVHMQSAVESTNSISKTMFEQSDVQRTKILNTGTAVLSLTTDIDRISNKAASFEKIANQTVSASDNGTQSVAKSIESMGSIKENMNETVRLTTRLNVFSTQISQIVDLLSDITEETSVLALNATVQATRAGEAGKGFKIVADSVQLLSNKATDATRRVGALIDAAMSDIQEIVTSVEKTNIEVENGTQLSEKAGEALEEIKNGSVQLQDIIRQISDDTHKNKRNAEAVTSGIEEILDATGQSKESNDQIAKSINAISQISNDLNRTVKRFIVE